MEVTEPTTTAFSTTIPRVREPMSTSTARPPGGRPARETNPFGEVDLRAALHAHQRGYQADGPGAGDQHPPRLPGGAAADPLDVLPRLGQHAGRLQQHAEVLQRRVDLDGILRMDAEALRAEAVALLDPALGVEAVA